MAMTEVLMPSMGEGVNEATLVRWLKKVGDKVEAGEPLLEVSTDKVDTEIPAPTGGFVTAALAQEGDVISVNQIIANIADAMGEQGAAKSTAKATASAPVKESAPTAASDAAPRVAAASSQAPSGPVRSSPLVRKMARDQQVDLGQVEGSGLHGRITKRDLVAYLENGPAPVRALPAQAPQPTATTRAERHDTGTFASRLKTTVVDGQEYHEGVPVVRERMSNMRKLIAEHMVESVRVSPHVTTVFEIDMHRVVALREKHKDEFERREGFKLTFTPFLIHAAVEAIKQHPIINVSLDGDDILHKKDINVGCAVALPNGLIVPVIKKAGELSLLGIARRLNDLVVRARTKKLLPEDVQGGTFSITNPGGFGSLTSNPIINQPQVAILGIGAIVKRPVVVDDMIAIRPQMLISITFDHRVIDGEGGARYLATMKDILETYHYAPV